MTDGNDINSVAGVLKLYLRELREPVFSVQYFDQFMELASETKYQLVLKISKNTGMGNQNIHTGQYKRIHIPIQATRGQTKYTHRLTA